MQVTRKPRNVFHSLDQLPSVKSWLMLVSILLPPACHKTSCHPYLIVVSRSQSFSKKDKDIFLTSRRKLPFLSSFSYFLCVFLASCQQINLNTLCKSSLECFDRSCWSHYQNAPQFTAKKCDWSLDLSKKKKKKKPFYCSYWSSLGLSLFPFQRVLLKLFKYRTFLQILSSLFQYPVHAS